MRVCRKQVDTQRFGITLRTTCGFTLIELLVVIAIIAILAAILFPVFSLVREKARQSTCASNLKQIGFAIALYNTDFDEYMPFGLLHYTCPTSAAQIPAACLNVGCSTGLPDLYSSNSYGIWWPQIIAPYMQHQTTISMSSKFAAVPQNWIGGNDVFLCPDNDEYSVPVDGISGYPPLTSYLFNPYANILAVHVGDTATDVSPGIWAGGTSPSYANTASGFKAGQPICLSQVTSPSSILMLCESNSGPSGLPSVYPRIDEATNYDAIPPQQLYGRHSGGNNVLFLDSHVKWTKSSLMTVKTGSNRYEPTSMWGWNPTTNKPSL